MSDSRRKRCSRRRRRIPPWFGWGSFSCHVPLLLLLLLASRCKGLSEKELAELLQIPIAVTPPEDFVFNEEIFLSEYEGPQRFWASNLVAPAENALIGPFAEEVETMPVNDSREVIGKLGNLDGDPDIFTLALSPQNPDELPPLPDLPAVDLFPRGNGPNFDLGSPTRIPEPSYLLLGVFGVFAAVYCRARRRPHYEVSC